MLKDNGFRKKNGERLKRMKTKRQAGCTKR